MLGVIAAIAGLPACRDLALHRALLRHLPRKALANVGAVLVAIAGFGAWAFRPRLQTLHGKSSGVVESPTSRACRDRRHATTSNTR
jgi:hypothetical protein